MKTSHSLRLYFLLLWATYTAWAVDPDKQISQYAHMAWRIQDGFFAGSPTAIAQTQDGYIWIGTDSGLLRFDGARLVCWSPENGERLLFRGVSH